MINLNLINLFIVLTQTISTPVFITEYHEALTEKEELQFINKYEKSEDITIKAYVVSFEMKQAKYEFYPWNKINKFNTHKKELENLITKYPNNIHLRYVRLVIQENVPDFLNYNDDIEEDKKFLKKTIEQEDSTDYIDNYIIKNTSL